MAIEKKKIQFEDLISKWWFWVGAILVIVLIGAIFFGEYPEEEKKQEQQKTAQVEEAKETKQASREKSEDDISILRKCTVMEAADLYNDTGYNGYDNTFDKAKKSCEKSRKDLGSDEFAKVVNEDWKSRSTEKIEEKPLSHYLNVLGW